MIKKDYIIYVLLVRRPVTSNDTDGCGPSNRALDPQMSA